MNKIKAGLLRFTRNDSIKYCSDNSTGKATTSPRNDEIVSIPTPTLPNKGGRRKCAFTLAEVLITLAIIGVVAAITMPTLIAHYKEKVFEAQYKKAYSTIANGIKAMMADEGVDLFADLPLSKCVPLLYEENLECAKPIMTKYFNVEPEVINGSVIWQLSDGSIFMLSIGDRVASGTIDSNGKKGPNYPAKDMYSFILDKHGNMVGNLRKISEVFGVNEDYLESVVSDICKKEYIDSMWYEWDDDDTIDESYRYVSKIFSFFDQLAMCNNHFE